MLLTDVKCARCSRLINVGETVVRVPGGASMGGGAEDVASALPRILHTACFDAVKV